MQIASLQANLPFDYLYLAKSRIKRVSKGEEEVWKVMEMYSYFLVEVEIFLSLRIFGKILM